MEWLSSLELPDAKFLSLEDAKAQDIPFATSALWERSIHGRDKREKGLEEEAMRMWKRDTESTDANPPKTQCWLTVVRIPRKSVSKKWSAGGRLACERGRMLMTNGSDVEVSTKQFGNWEPKKKKDSLCETVFGRKMIPSILALRALCDGTGTKHFVRVMISFSLLMEKRVACMLDEHNVVVLPLTKLLDECCKLGGLPVEHPWVARTLEGSSCSSGEEDDFVRKQREAKMIHQRRMELRMQDSRRDSTVVHACTLGDDFPVEYEDMMSETSSIEDDPYANTPMRTIFALSLSMDLCVYAMRPWVAAAAAALRYAVLGSAECKVEHGNQTIYGSRIWEREKRKSKEQCHCMEVRATLAALVHNGGKLNENRLLVSEWKSKAKDTSGWSLVHCFVSGKVMESVDSVDFAWLLSFFQYCGIVQLDRKALEAIKRARLVRNTFAHGRIDNMNDENLSVEECILAMKDLLVCLEGCIRELGQEGEVFDRFSGCDRGFGESGRGFARQSVKGLDVLMERYMSGKMLVRCIDAAEERARSKWYNARKKEYALQLDTLNVNSLVPYELYGTLDEKQWRAVVHGAAAARELAVKNGWRKRFQLDSFEIYSHLHVRLRGDRLYTSLLAIAISMVVFLVLFLGGFFLTLSAMCGIVAYFGVLVMFIPIAIFPLASPLWKYFSFNTDEKKVEQTSILKEAYGSVFHDVCGDHCISATIEIIDERPFLVFRELIDPVMREDLAEETFIHLEDLSDEIPRGLWGFMNEEKWASFRGVWSDIIAGHALREDRLLRTFLMIAVLFFQVLAALVLMDEVDLVNCRFFASFVICFTIMTISVTIWQYANRRGIFFSNILEVEKKPSKISSFDLHLWPASIPENVCEVAESLRAYAPVLDDRLVWELGYAEDRDGKSWQSVESDPYKSLLGTRGDRVKFLNLVTKKSLMIRVRNKI